MPNFADCKDEHNEEVLVDVEQIVEVRKVLIYGVEGVKETHVTYKNGVVAILHYDCYDYLRNILRSE